MIEAMKGKKMIKMNHITSLYSPATIRLPALLLAIIAVTSVASAHAQDEVGIDLSKRQLWHINPLVDKLVKKGVLPEKIASNSKQRKADGIAELAKLKIAYMQIGARIRHEITNPGQAISEDELTKLATEHLNAVSAYKLSGFRDMLALFQSLPEPVKAKLKSGDYDDLMPRKFASKKSPGWMEKGAAKKANLTDQQARKWDAIHETHLAELTAFKNGKLAASDAKREAALFQALFASDEKAALVAYRSDYDVRIEPDRMKIREFTKLFAILTDEQKAAYNKDRLKTYGRQKASIAKFSFDKKK